jgi:hypothetical protein
MSRLKRQWPLTKQHAPKHNRKHIHRSGNVAVDDERLATPTTPHTPMITLLDPHSLLAMVLQLPEALGTLLRSESLAHNHDGKVV